MKNLNRNAILALTFRTYFIRVFYNYINLFGEGLCYCLLPAIKIEKESLLRKHLKFFNTNEYLSGFALGIILNLEYNNRFEDEDKAKDILSSVAGSVGDRLIYKLILPVIILTALNKFVISDFSIDGCTVAIVASEIVIFNIFSFWIRYYGIKTGYEKGIDSIKIFKSSAYRRILYALTIFRNILAILLIMNLIILNI